MGEGTGLGLSISHDIVRGLGGMLCVDSIEGQGSCFRVLLPLVTETPVDRPPHEGVLHQSVA